ncbi:MAG: DUF6531 domain-containing protein [Erysipelotrichaceae bacterium]|nr:DUF6531 domain-containing protein [Erysipelotrichaceae bacterium]
MNIIKRAVLCLIVAAELLYVLQPVEILAKDNLKEQFNEKGVAELTKTEAATFYDYDLSSTKPIRRIAENTKDSVLLKKADAETKKIEFETVLKGDSIFTKKKDKYKQYNIKASRFESTIPEVLDQQHQIEINYNDTHITYLPMFNNFNDSFASKDTVIYYSDNRNIVFKYFAYDDAFKEEIIVYAPQLEYVFYYDMVIENGQLIEDNGHYIIESNDKKKLLEVRAPVVVDAVGERLEELDIDIYQTESGYHIELVIDADWMNDDQRVYPIIIDPEFKDVASQTDTMISEENPNTNYAYDTILSVGFDELKEYRPFFKFNEQQLAQMIAEGAIVNDAIFSLYVLDDTQLQNQNIQLCSLDTTYDPVLLTWANGFQIASSCLATTPVIDQDLKYFNDLFPQLDSAPIDFSLSYQINSGTPLSAMDENDLYYLFDHDQTTYVSSDNGTELVDQSIVIDLNQFIRPEEIMIAFGGDVDSSGEQLSLTFLNTNTNEKTTQLLSNSMSSSTLPTDYELTVQFTPTVALYDQIIIQVNSQQAGGKPRINEFQITKYQLEEHYLSIDISDYLQSLVDEEIDNNGFYLKLASNLEQKIDFVSNDGNDHLPTFSVDYESTYDVSLNYDLDDLTLKVVPSVNYQGSTASFDEVTFKGISTPGSSVTLYFKEYNQPDNIVNGEVISNIGTTFITEDISNYESYHHFSTSDLKQNGVYQVEVIAEKDGVVTQVVSEVFMIAYLSYYNNIADLAFFYGVDASMLREDNNITGDLDQNSVIFVRNPKRNIGISYSSASIDYINDTQNSDYMLGLNSYNEYYVNKVNINTGNYHLSQTDMTYMMFGNEVEIVRVYNSKNSMELSQFGTNWDYDFNFVLMNYDDNTLVFKKEDGQKIYFVKSVIQIFHLLNFL